MIISYTEKRLSDFFKDFVKDLQDDDTKLMSEGLGSAEFTGYIDSGCYAFNALVSGTIFGGIPNNSATALAGDPATGKTFFVLSIIEHFLKANPDAGVYFAETESAVRNAMAEARGIDTSRVIRAEPETLHDFKVKFVDFLEKYAAAKNRPPMLSALDSLGMLPSSMEVNDAKADKDVKDMSRSSVIKGIFRIIRLRMAKLKVPMLITNHVYAGVGPYAPQRVIAGGSGLIYTADTIVMLSKKKIKEGDEIVGNLIKARTYKARLARENQEVELRLDYDKGLDRYHGLHEIATDLGIFKKLATKWELPGGAKVFGKEIAENPEQVFTDEILKEIDAGCPKLFQYGTHS